MRLGIDIGGTFTDIVLLNEKTGEYYSAKVPTTPKDFKMGVIESVKRVLSQYNVSPEEIDFASHGTTIATNTIIERDGAKTAFITTEGFQDMLEIGRLAKPPELLYNFHFKLADPLVPRPLCFEVEERLDYEGNVIKKLNEGDVRKISGKLKKAGVESTAVCMLFSFLNPKHEEKIEEILSQECPGMYISTSSGIVREIFEYERASTTVVNAYIGPIVSKYFLEMRKSLKDLGLKCELFIMQSNGGIMAPEVLAKKPVYTVESGPAAGVIGASFIGKLLGLKNIMSYDMGGTSAKFACIRDYQPLYSPQYEVGGVMHEGRVLRGSGYPVMVSAIDLVEIGAGGGSIAWVDPVGGLRVGPRSAGADPGPACYGLGGADLTVTDSDLILGYLDPDYFLGGTMKLYPEKAREACKRLEDQLGMSTLEVARGVFKIVNIQMANAARVASVERGLDPRDFVLMAFGGAGPVHACALQREVKNPWILVPDKPGVFSALGVAVADLRLDYIQTFEMETSRLKKFDQVEKIFKTLEDQGIKDLIRTGTPAENMKFTRFLDMRYLGQNAWVTVPIPRVEFTQDVMSKAIGDFHVRHYELNGFRLDAEPVEIANIRETAIGATMALSPLKKEKEHGRDSKGAMKATRMVYFEEIGDYVETPIYERKKLYPGNVIEGPAVVQQEDTTVVILPDYVAKVDHYCNITIGEEEWK